MNDSAQVERIATQIVRRFSGNYFAAIKDAQEALEGSSAMSTIDLYNDVIWQIKKWQHDDAHHAETGE